MRQSWSWLPATTVSLLASAAVAALAVWPVLPQSAEESARPAPAMAGMAMPPAVAQHSGLHAHTTRLEAVQAAPAAPNTVAIQGFAYAPATLTVKAGTTVTWTNQDQDPHTVTSMNGGPLRSPTMNNGATFRYTFSTPGRFEYLCTIHPFMTATVVVTP